MLYMVRTMKPRQDEVDDTDWALVSNLDAVASLLRGEAARDLREESLTPGGVTLLELALLQNGATSSTLASMLGISRQAASKAVQALVEQGLLEAKAHPEDARAQRITVTAAGKKAIQRSRTRREPSLGRFLEPLTAKERATLGELVEKLRLNARPQLLKAEAQGDNPAGSAAGGVQ